MSYIEFHNVTKTYHQGEVDIHALSDISFEAEKVRLSLLPVPPGQANPPS